MEHVPIRHTNRLSNTGQLLAITSIVTALTLLLAACDLGADEEAAPLVQPELPTSAATAAPTPTTAEAGTADEAYLGFLRRTVINLRTLAPGLRDLLENPRVDDGFWGLRLREMTGGFSGMFDQLVARDPPDDWARYRLTLISALGSTVEGVGLAADAWANFDFPTFTSALEIGVRSLGRLDETLQEYELLDPGGAVPPGG